MKSLETDLMSDAMRPYASRISVLPFECMDGSVGDERLARGFWQDIIIELSRFPALGVMAARSATFTTTAGAKAERDDREVVSDYVVSGAVTRAGRVIRVRAQLLDARSGRQLWGERYDRPAEELFEIQDAITARVANALHARIDQQHLAAARRRAVTELAAYEAWLRGYDCLQQGTLAADAEARALFQRALDIDPQFARGYAGLSMSYFNEWSCNAWERWEETERQAFKYAQQAEALDPHDQLVQLILGRIQQYRRRFDMAEHHLRRALSLAPNDAETLIQLAAYLALQGQAELGVKLAERSLDLNPLCPNWRYPYAAIPHFVARQYAETMALLRKAPVSLMVDLPVYLAAAAAYSGDTDQAVAMLATFERQFGERIAPGRKLDWKEIEAWLRHVNAYRRDEDQEHLLEGVRRARALQRGAARPAAAVASPPAPVPGQPVGRLLAWPIANTFRKEGPMWIVAFDHRVVHVPELKGFRDIACLLGRPNEEVHCLALDGRGEGGVAHSGSVIDERARREYQSRIREVRAELAEAGEANDPGRAARAQEELDALLAEVGRATGMGGRARKLGDLAERARSAVAWRIRKAVQTVADQHPALGRHLDNSLQTGVFCRYSPEKPVDWEV